MIFFNILDHPTCLNIRVLPNELKQLASTRLKPYMHVHRIKGVIDYMFSEDLSEHLDEFKKYTIALDSSRNESILDVVPEMKDIFK